jgi:hypothetical protein
MDVVGYGGRRFFCGTMAYSGEYVELGVLKLGAKSTGRTDRDSAVAVAPEDESLRGEFVEQEPTEVGHIVVPGA